MRHAVDYVIIGAGIAGMTLRHVLKGKSAVLLDAHPGRYKIGESIIPQHFAEPEVASFFPVARKLASATPKDGSVFLEERSVGGFELFPDTALHVARQELEAAMVEHFGIEIVRERVESIDVEARTVTTDQGVWEARELIVDCSGPARLLARSLGMTRELWPVWAAWSYQDVLEADDERFWDHLRRGEREYWRVTLERQLERCQEYGGFRPSFCTNLTRVRENTWSWQIPLHGARILSVGVVSRNGPVTEEEYLDVVSRSISPQFRTQIRPWDRSGPMNGFHVRHRFAWVSDRFAGDSWALLGDAAFFGDPIFSVGTGFATNHAIQLGRVLRDGGWNARRAEAHQRQTAHMFERTKRAYEAWYGGSVLADADLAEDIQQHILTGRAFQVQATDAYMDLWAASHPQDADTGVVPLTGEPMTEEAARVVGASLAGFQLRHAGAFRTRLDLTWERPGEAPVVLRVEPHDPARPAFATAGGLALSHVRGVDREPASHAAGALLDAFSGVLRSAGDAIRALLADAPVDPKLARSAVPSEGGTGLSSTFLRTPGTPAMTDLATRCLDTIPRWLKSLGDDATSLAALLGDTSVPEPTRRLVAGGLNYLFKSLDLIPDGIEDLGFVDDAFVLRVAAAIAGEDPASSANPVIARLADDAKLIRELLGDADAWRFVRYIRALSEGSARGRTVDQIVGDPSVRSAFVSEVAGWAKGYEVPTFTRDEKNLVKLKSFLSTKLPA